MPAEVRARAIARQIEPAAKILAGAIEKDMRRLQETRLAAREAFPREMRKDGSKA
jgi:hypothetical protein